MESIVRALAVYLILLVVFRLAGRRSLAQITTFDVILLLIVSEAIQQALLDDDNSMTGAFLLVLTLIGVDVLFAFLKQRFARFEHIAQPTPRVIFSNGRLHVERMDRDRVDEDDILHAGRSQAGLTSLDDIEYAVLESNGMITVIPKRGDRS